MQISEDILNQLSDEDLVHISKGNLEGVSDYGLSLISGTPVDFSASKMAGNVLPSLAKNAKEVVGAVMHPVNTATSIADLGWSLANQASKALGSDQYDPEALKSSNALGRNLKNRYGSLDAIKSTLMDDPAGVMLDAAGLFSGTGALTKSKTLSTIGKYMDPLTYPIAALSGSKNATKKLFNADSFGEKLYQSGMQFSDLDVMREALKRGVSPDSLPDIIAQRKAQGATIGNLVGEASKTAVRTPASKLVSGLDTAYDNLPAPSIDAGAAQRGFTKYTEALHKNLGYEPPSTRTYTREVSDPANVIRYDPVYSSVLDTNGNKIQTGTNPVFGTKTETITEDLPGIDPTFSLSDIQDLKTTGYKKLYSPKGDLRLYAPGAQAGVNAAQKQVTRNAQQILDSALGPEYKAANTEFGKLSDIESELEKITKRINTHGGVAVPKLIAADTGAALGGALYGPKGLGIGALSALALNQVLPPARRVSTGLFLDKMGRTIDKAKSQFSPMRTPLEAILQELQQEEDKKFARRVSLGDY